MTVIIVPLKDMVLDLEQPADLTALPPEQAIALIRESFTFLSTAIDISIENGLVTISYPEESAQRVEEALKWYRNGVKEAEQGNYKRAISLFTRVLERLPAHADAQRNLAMAFMESGETDKARDHLILALKLNPQDAWSYVLLGNLHSKYEKDFERAEKWYRRAYELNPKDPTLLTNYGALMVHRGNKEQAAEFFERAIESDPEYPNSYYALAILEMEAGKPDRARQVLDDLFARSRPTDVRSGPLYGECRKLYLTANRGAAEGSFDRLMGAVKVLKQKLEGETGYRIEVTEDNSLETISAVLQMAWKHNRDRHVIRYRNRQRAMTPHLLAHELVHISLEDAARKAGRNRLFTTNARTHEVALRSIQDDIRALRNLGVTSDRLSDLTEQLISGLANQLSGLNSS